MSRKAIHLQHINESGLISKTAPVPWCSVTWDNVKMVIDAYKDGIEPREDCVIEIVDGHTCYQLTAEELMKAIRFYIAYSTDKDAITQRPNKFQYIIPDAIKPVLKGQKHSNY